jgi:tetratricopeptide (TPR) repeat protein
MDEPLEAAVGSRLAHALLAQGRFDEAAGALGVEEDPTGSVGTRVLWLSASAKVEADRSNAELALARAREAVDLAETTDALSLHGDALMDLAEVLSIGGRTSEAISAVEAALELYERKGNVVSAAHATETLSRFRSQDRSV